MQKRSLQASIHRRNKKFCLAENWGYVSNRDTSKATDLHFTSPGHSLSDLCIIPLEQVRKNNTSNRTQREEYHIRRFDTLKKGMNKKI